MKMKKRYKVLYAFTILIVIIMGTAFFLGIRPGIKTTTIKVEDKLLKVEIAEMFSEGKRGLMWRLYLPSDRGMIFINSGNYNVAFWMKNTFLPLSIAFVDKNGIILSIQKMKPLDTSIRYRSPSSYQYAIEVNQGWFKTKNISEGARVSFVDPNWSRKKEINRVY